MSHLFPALSVHCSFLSYDKQYDKQGIIQVLFSLAQFILSDAKKVKSALTNNPDLKRSRKNRHRKESKKVIYFCLDHDKSYLEINHCFEIEGY